MNLRLPALAPWMVLAGAAFGQVRTADVLYTYRQSTPQPGYRLGDECFVSLDTVQTWGWKILKQGDSVDLQAEGRTLHVDTRYVSGKITIPLRKAIIDLGGQSAWTSGADTLNVFSSLKRLTVGRDLHVHVEGGLAFKPEPFYISPGRTIIDIEGARLSSQTIEEFGGNVKATQYRPNTVRLLVDTQFVPKLPENKPESTDTYDFQISRDDLVADNVDTKPITVTPPPRTTPHSRPVATPPRNVTPPITTPPVQQTDPYGGSADFPSTVPPITPIEPVGSPAVGAPTITSLSLDNDTPSTTFLGIHFSAPFTGQAVVTRPDPDTLQVSVPAGTQSTNYSISSQSVDSVTTQMVGGSTVFRFQLSRAMGAEVITEHGGISIELLKPDVGNGRLAGKIVVVDPGHGAQDRGAHYGQLNEKDLNLSIGRLVGADFAAAGATVIMTRRDDTFIPLTERSDIANRNKANFFISCHINSTGGDGSQSGTITFHRMNSQTGQLLAQCIQDQIRRVNGLPNLGAWSDGRIYRTGFSVLRNTHVPCVLIEMGFINNAKDRAQMVTDDFQKSVAAAVVKGVRVFLGDSKPNE